MEYIPNQRVSYDSETGTYFYSPWYLARDLWGGKIVRQKVAERIKVPSYLGIAWRCWDMDALVMYPKPLHLIARFIRNCYWIFLKFFYRLGLIDTGEGEMFTWADFFRIKVH